MINNKDKKQEKRKAARDTLSTILLYRFRTDNVIPGTTRDTNHVKKTTEGTRGHTHRSSLGRHQRAGQIQKHHLDPRATRLNTTRQQREPEKRHTCSFSVCQRFNAIKAT